MQVVLLNDTDGRKNIGCCLTSSLLKEQIARHFSAKYDDFELSAFPWRFGRHSARRRIWAAALPWMAFRAEQTRTTTLFSAWLAALARQEYGPEAVEAALHADAVVFQPEGSISDWHTTCDILNLLSLPLLACIRSVPVFVMNGTFPLHKDCRFTLIKTFLDLCCDVALRDRMSAEHYKARFMPDAAVMWPDTACANHQESSPFYALITTGAQCPKATNIRLAAEALAFCRKMHLKPLIMSKQHSHLASLRPAIARLGGHVVEMATLAQASQWLSQCKIHIGGRYHMALFCLAHHVPSVLIPVNTHKNRWLSEEFPGITLADSVEQVGQAAVSVYDKTHELAPQMANALNDARNVVQDEMTYAVSLIDEMRASESISTSKMAEAIRQVQCQMRFVDVIRQATARPRIRWRHMAVSAAKTVLGPNRVHGLGRRLQKRKESK